MGGHGGLNILPQKRWNVYREDNKEKVRKDEEAAAKEEQLKLEQQRKRDAEFRLDRLRAARGLAPPETLAAEPPLETDKNPGHINLFEGIKIFDPIRKSDEGSDSRDGHKRKKMKKEEAPKVVSAEDEKYRLGYGVAGKGVKLPWYLEKKGGVDTASVENGESEVGLKRGGGGEEEKRSGKKSLAELREERLKRERREKERERTLIEEQTRKSRNNHSHGSVFRDRSYSSWR